MTYSVIVGNIVWLKTQLIILDVLLVIVIFIFIFYTINIIKSLSKKQR